MNAARHFVAQCLRIVVIVLTNLWLAGTILGCGSGVVRVVPAKSTTLEQMLDADVVADARRPAHWMKEWVRGGSSDRVGVFQNDKLPEAYTRIGEPGTSRSQYHLAYAALRLIREHYAAAHPEHRALESEGLMEIVDAAGGNLGLVEDFDRNRHVDIANVEKRLLFEVAPPGKEHRTAATNKLDRLLEVLNKAMVGVPTFQLGTDYAGEIGVRFAEGAPPWKITFENTAPGIVQYRWLALSAKDESEDAYREAYQDNRWHEPTPYEITRFARALHEVVERLVQAREALGRTRAAAKMPILPGKTWADYLRSATLWSANDSIARLLPIMREPPPPSAQVRPDPRLVAETPDGSSSGAGSSPQMYPGATTPDGVVVPPHPSAPEAYTMDGYPGKMPWEFFMGYSAHRAIGYRYWARHQHGGDIVFRNHISVATIVQDAGGKKALLHWSEADLRPDITHVRYKKPEHFAFEIKPPGDVHLAKGKVKLAQYIGALNLGMAGTSKVFVPGPDESGELWIMFKRGRLIWRLTWKSTAPGILQYKWDRPDTKPEEEDVRLREEAWKQAIKDGRWSDISKPEMENNAKELFETVEAMVLRRDVLRLFRDGVTVLVDGVGAAAEAILSARLWDHIDRAPVVVPIVRVPPPVKQPTVSPKAPPPVNARSLGSDKRMAPKSSRPSGQEKPSKTISPN